MARVLGLCFFVIFGFYVVWPAYSIFAIKSAVDTGNSDRLAAKVDFDQVRSSLRPAVSSEVEKAMTAAIQHGGKDNAQLLTQLKVGLMPNVVEIALANLVTADSVVRIYREGGDVRTTIRKIVSEKMGSGGLGALAGLIGGKSREGGSVTLNDVLKTVGQATDADAANPQPPLSGPASGSTDLGKFGLSNVKSFTINGPTSFSLGLSRSASTALADATVDMAFTGLDWKIVGVRPRL